MSIAVQPRRFITARHLDTEDINANLLASARDVNENLSRRYTHSTQVFPLAGLDDGDGLGVRTLRVLPPISGDTTEIIAVEMRICCDAGQVWSLTCSGLPTLDVTGLGSGTEASGSYSRSLSLTNAVAPSFVLSADIAGAAITAGEVVVHLRSDRGNQGGTYAPFTPTLYDVATSTAGATADAQLTALATAVTQDSTNDHDLRCEVYAVRDLGSGATVTFICPSGVRRLRAAQLFISGDAGRVVDASVGGGVVGVAMTLPATGTGTLDKAVDTPTSQTIPDNPTDPADDTFVVITETSTTGNVPWAYVALWWS